MDRYLFVPRVLRQIEDGNTFRIGVSIVLRVAAVAVALLATISWIGLWALARVFEAAAVLGLVLFQALFVVATYAIVHTIWIRAADVRLQPVQQFSVLPIVAVCSRLLGECLAWFFCALGTGGALLMLIAGPYAQMATGQMPLSGLLSPGVGFFGAMLYLAMGVICGFVSLLFFYLVAESGSLLQAIARNTEIVSKQADRYGPVV